MPSPIYGAVMNNSNSPQGGNYDVIRQFGSFKQDPFAFMLKKKGIIIPEEYRDNPQGAVQYLINSGQMTNEQLIFLKGMARKMNILIN